MSKLSEIGKQLAEKKIRLNVCGKPTPEEIDETVEMIHETGILPEKYDVEQCYTLAEMVDFCKAHKVDAVFAEPMDQGWCLKAYYLNICKVFTL